MSDLLRLTAQMAVAYLGPNSRNGMNRMPLEDVPVFLNSIHEAFATPPVEASKSVAEPQRPAVPIKKSVHDDYIVCLEDGKRLKMLKRYLHSHYDMTPEQYRRRWNLPADYPMVAPTYAAHRSDLAKKTGLGKIVRRTALKKPPKGGTR
jgi:predicted transcriptional regulator